MHVLYKMNNVQWVNVSRTGLLTVITGCDFKLATETKIAKPTRFVIAVGLRYPLSYHRCPLCFSLELLGEPRIHVILHTPAHSSQHLTDVCSLQTIRVDAAHGQTMGSHYQPDVL